MISKSTAYKDTKIKKDLCEKFGVKEYIIVYPDFQMAERYVLYNNRYGAPERFNWDETLKLKTFDIKVNLWEIFEKELPKNNKKIMNKGGFSPVKCQKTIETFNTLLQILF